MKTPAVMPNRMSDPMGKESWEQTSFEGTKALSWGSLAPLHSRATLPQKCGPEGLPAYKGDSPLHCPLSPVSPSPPQPKCPVTPSPLTSGAQHGTWLAPGLVLSPTARDWPPACSPSVSHRMQLQVSPRGERDWEGRAAWACQWCHLTHGMPVARLTPGQAGLQPG